MALGPNEAGMTLAGYSFTVMGEEVHPVLGLALLVHDCLGKRVLFNFPEAKPDENNICKSDISRVLTLERKVGGRPGYFLRDPSIMIAAARWECAVSCESCIMQLTKLAGYRMYCAYRTAVVDSEIACRGGPGPAGGRVEMGGLVQERTAPCFLLTYLTTRERVERWGGSEWREDGIASVSLCGRMKHVPMAATLPAKAKRMIGMEARIGSTTRVLWVDLYVSVILR